MHETQTAKCIFPFKCFIGCARTANLMFYITKDDDYCTFGLRKKFANLKLIADLMNVQLNEAFRTRSEEATVLFDTNSRSYYLKTHALRFLQPTTVFSRLPCRHIKLHQLVFCLSVQVFTKWNSCSFTLTNIISYLLRIAWLTIYLLLFILQRSPRTKLILYWKQLTEMVLAY